MSSSSTLLLSKEFHDLKRRPRSNYFQVHCLDADCIHRWVVYVIGPPRTLYEGGVFRTLIRFPRNYPMDPPSVQFQSQILHPNIYRDGKVCISTLQKALPRETAEGSSASALPVSTNARGGNNWRPVLGVEQVYLSVVSLLSDPNLDDPANAAAANQMRADIDQFKDTVKVLCKLSRDEVPGDFVFPVVVHASPSSASVSCEETSGKTKARTDGEGRHGDVVYFDSGSDGEEYIYSEDEWQENNSMSEDEGEEEEEEKNEDEEKGEGKLDGDMNAPGSKRKRM